MACGDKIAGAHLLYYAPFGVAATASVWVGTTGNEGIQLIQTRLWTQIQGDDTGPEADIDAVYQGKNTELAFVLQDVNLDIVQQFLNPETCTYSGGAVNAARQEDYGVAGRFACAMIGILTAIPVAFTPAQAFSGGSASGTAGTYPGTPASSPQSGRRFKGIVTSELMEELGAAPRFVPVRFKCYPYDVSGVKKVWKWVTTATEAET